MQPSPPLAPPRVALLMVSLSPHAAKTSSTTHEVVLDAWRQHVVEPLTRDVPGTLLRSFLCFHPSGIFEPTKGSAAPSLEARRAHVSELYANISEEVEVVLASAEPLREQSELGAADPLAQPVPVDSPYAAAMRPNYPDQYARLAGCAQAMRQHELRTRRLFHWVIKARPDLLWVRRVPPLASLDPNRVSLRARALVFDAPRPISFAALTTDRAGCDPKLFLGRPHANACARLDLEAKRWPKSGANARASDPTSDGYASPNDPKRIEKDPQCEALALADMRARMRRASIATCGVWDDQCALAIARRFP